VRDARKIQIAQRLRTETGVTLKRIAAALHRGAWTHISDRLAQVSQPNASNETELNLSHSEDPFMTNPVTKQGKSRSKSLSTRRRAVFRLALSKELYMNVQTAVSEIGTRLRPLVCAICVGILPPASRASALFDLDFTAPDLGAYQMVAGTPSIQASAGVFTDALIFDAVTSGEQIRLPIGVSGPRYEIGFDVLTHNLVNSGYSFGVYFDTPTVRSVNFHGGLGNVYLYQSFPFLNLSLASLVDDAVYHIDVALDAEHSAWSVVINGNPLFSGSCDAAAFQGIRFGTSRWLGSAADAPESYVALDNVRVSVVPEPSAAALAGCGVLAWLRFYRRKFQNGN
jgi:hypothetical protein